MCSKTTSVYLSIIFISLWFLSLQRSVVRGKSATENTGPKLSEIIIPNCTVPACQGELGPIYCHGKILALSWHFFGASYSDCTGSKLLHSANQVLANFDKLPENPTKEEFTKFCQENFEDADYLEKVHPADWVPNPPNFQKIADKRYRDFADKLNDRWRQLTRKVRKEVETHRDLYPAIYVPNNFVIPGGGFSIYFYWDSFWIAKGLLVSGMDQTVRGILENFGALVDSLGYIPNGGLLKLSERSQPPVFTQMVHDYVNSTGKNDILSLILPKLDREMDWWWENRTINVTLSEGGTHTLFQYRSRMNCPRPEAYSTDILDAENSTNDEEYVWSSIASACESGWDFSTRWFAYEGPGAGTKAQIMTRDLVPVDLNSFMCKNYAILADFHDSAGSKETENMYRARLKNLKAAIESVLWNDDDGIWYDFDMKKQIHRRRFYPSNFLPLYGGCEDTLKDKEAKLWNYTTSSGAFEFPGGIPTSLNLSGQQWDFPNVWSPLVHLVVEGFRLSNFSQNFTELAYNISSKWVRSNYEGFMRTDSMWEKYDARYPDGRKGGGGEYPVQEGFGWTNGVILDLLMKYGDRLQVSGGSSGSSTATVIWIVALVLLVLVIAFWYSTKYIQYRKHLNSLKSTCCKEESHGLLQDDDF